MPVNHDRFSNSMPVVRGLMLVGAKECFLLAHFKVSSEKLFCLFLRQAFNVLIFYKEIENCPMSNLAFLCLCNCVSFLSLPFSPGDLEFCTYKMAHLPFIIQVQIPT